MPSPMNAPKVAKTFPVTGTLRVPRTPLQEGETFAINLPKNFGEITAPTIFPSAEKLAFPGPQRRLASLPLATVANEALALQIHVRHLTHVIVILYIKSYLLSPTVYVGHPEFFGLAFCCHYFGERVQDVT